MSKQTKETNPTLSFIRSFLRMNLKRNNFGISTKLKDRFIQYYQTNYWGGNESISGRGSDSIQTKQIIIELNSLINSLKIKSLLDIPCGDFNWMKNIDFKDKEYIGGDIVPELVFKNSELYRDKSCLSFKVMDIIKDELPQVDLIICRDCLVHFSYNSILNSISNIKKSKSKFLLSTSFINHEKNHNIFSGDWRPINLQRKPFNFPAPILIINENCTEDQGKYNDKSLCLWKIEDI